MATRLASPMNPASRGAAMPVRRLVLTRTRAAPSQPLGAARLDKRNAEDAVEDHARDRALLDSRL